MRRILAAARRASMGALVCFSLGGTGALVTVPAAADVLFGFNQTGPVTAGNGSPSMVPPTIGSAYLGITEAAFLAGMNVSFDAFGNCQPNCPPLNLAAFGITQIRMPDLGGPGIGEGNFDPAGLGGSGRVTLILQSAPQGTPVGTIHWSDGTTGSTWTLDGANSFLRLQSPASYFLIAQGLTSEVPEPASLGLLVVAMAGLGLLRGGAKTRSN